MPTPRKVILTNIVAPASKVLTNFMAKALLTPILGTAAVEMADGVIDAFVGDPVSDFITEGATTLEEKDLQNTLRTIGTIATKAIGEYVRRRGPPSRKSG